MSSANDVPIIGASAKVHDVSINIVITCSCGNPTPLVIMGGHRAFAPMCKTCKRFYFVSGMTIENGNLQGGDMKIHVGSATQTRVNTTADAPGPGQAGQVDITDLVKGD